MKIVTSLTFATRTLVLASALFLGACNLFEEDPKDKPAGSILPTGLSYTVSGSFTAGVAITAVTPSLATGDSVVYTVAPALPAGLSLNASTGVLSGTPSVVLDSTAYVFTATNLAGAAKDTVILVVSSVSTTSWNGLPLDSLRHAGAILFHQGKLLIGNRLSGQPGIAIVDTGTGKITGYYTETLPPSSMAVAADGRVIITESNYTEGAVSVLNVEASVLRKSVISFGSDNGVVSEGGRVYLFDRTTGVVTGFTGSAPGQNVAFNVQTGAGTNPYDIAVTNGKAYIPRYNSKSLLILDVTLLGGGIRDSIDLSAYAMDTSNSAPRMASVTASGGYVFVTLQRLNAFYEANDTSLVLVINASTKAIEKTIPLQFKNPTSARVVNGIWYISCLGNYMANDGGVEKINLTTREHAGIAITEATLGADVGEYVPTSNGAAYVSYSNNYFANVKVKKVSAP